MTVTALYNQFRGQKPDVSDGIIRLGSAIATSALRSCLE
jgi:hypothetical protein